MFPTKQGECARATEALPREKSTRTQSEHANISDAGSSRNCVADLSTASKTLKLSSIALQTQACIRLDRGC